MKPNPTALLAAAACDARAEHWRARAGDAWPAEPEAVRRAADWRRAALAMLAVSSSATSAATALTAAADCDKRAEHWQARAGDVRVTIPTGPGRIVDPEALAAANEWRVRADGLFKLAFA